MNSKLSVEEVLSNLERCAVFYREQEALHARQVVHLRRGPGLLGAELPSSPIDSFERQNGNVPITGLR